MAFSGFGSTPFETAIKMHARAEQVPFFLGAVVSEVIRSAAQRARSYFGELQESWEPLAASTVATKARLGFTPPDYQPLLRTGQTRDSVSTHQVELEGEIGSNDPVLGMLERGTSHMPPRSTIGLAMMETIPEALELLDHVAEDIFAP